MVPEWNPDTYGDSIRAELPLYDRLQEEAARATESHDAEAVLELGVGSGETARRIIARHPRAHLTGIDSSESMLSRARADLDRHRVELRLQRLEDELPAGPFDLVVSVLVVHHLDATGKADLFRRVAEVLAPGGRLVLGDLVVPRRPQDAVTPVDGSYDRPSTIDEQLAWLRQAGLEASVAWEHQDLAVLVARLSAVGASRL